MKTEEKEINSTKLFCLETAIKIMCSVVINPSSLPTTKEIIKCAKELESYLTT